MGKKLKKLKRNVKDSFPEFAENMKECFEALGKDIKEAVIVNRTALCELNDKMDSKLKAIEKKLEKDTEIPVEYPKENEETK